MISRLIVHRLHKHPPQQNLAINRTVHTNSLEMLLIALDCFVHLHIRRQQAWNNATGGVLQFGHSYIDDVTTQPETGSEAVCRSAVNFSANGY